MGEQIIILECPECSTKKEVEYKIMISKKLFKCDKCKFGAEHYKWIKHYPDGRVHRPD